MKLVLKRRHYLSLFIIFFVVLQTGLITYVYSGSNENEFSENGNLMKNRPKTLIEVKKRKRADFIPLL